MAVEPLDDDGRRRPPRRGGGRQQARDAGDPCPARSCRPGGRPQVRLQRRPQRPRTCVGPRDRRPGGGRRGRPRVPARARHRDLVVHGRGRWRRGGPGQRDTVARRGRRVAAALPGSGRGGRDDRPDRRGAVGRRHGRWRLRGRRPRPADRARVVRPLGPPARRRAGRRGHEHQHRQGRRVRSRLRADPPVRVGRPRRHRGSRRRRPLDPPDQQRRRPDRRGDQRRAARRPRRGQADLDARPTAAVGRPRSPARPSTRRTTSGATSAWCRRRASWPRRW